MEAFNWVNAIARCSMPTIFELLAEVVTSDVAAANSIGKKREFKMDRPTDDRIAVIGVGQFGDDLNAERGVLFVRGQSRIEVQTFYPRSPTRTPIFSCSPSLNREGECKLGIAGDADEPLELWQVSRRALQDLFFGD